MMQSNLTLILKFVTATNTLTALTLFPDIDPREEATVLLVVAASFWCLFPRGLTPTVITSVLFHLADRCSLIYDLEFFNV